MPLFYAADVQIIPKREFDLTANIPLSCVESS